MLTRHQLHPDIHAPPNVLRLGAACPTLTTFSLWVQDMSVNENVTKEILSKHSEMNPSKCMYHSQMQMNPPSVDPNIILHRQQ